MFESKGLMASFYKEINKLVGLTNYLEWKKRIGLALIRHEVMNMSSVKLLNMEKT